MGASALALQACSSDSDDTPTTTVTDAGTKADSGTKTDAATGQDSGTGGSTATGASALLAAVTDAGVTGTASFEQQDGSVALTVSVTNAAPGTHGFHVHNGTDCTAPGPHYGPDGGPPYHGEFKIEVGDDGTGSLSTTSTDITIAGSEFPILGHAVVFHALPLPDAGTTPAPRQACGVLAAGAFR
jgi:Cu-Zn family superoxide dismutase